MPPKTKKGSGAKDWSDGYYDSMGFLKDSGQDYPGYLKYKTISDELADFLGKPHGTRMTREEASRHINDYILFNHLINGRNFRYDYQLFDLLKIPEGDTLSISDFRKYLGQHFT